MLYFETLVFDNDNIYTQAEDNGFILRISKRDWMARIIANVPDTFFRCGTLYADKIYFVDSKSRSICSIDKKGNCVTELTLTKYYAKDSLLYPLINYNGNLLVFSDVDNHYINYDLVTQKAENNSFHFGEGRKTFHVCGDKLFICSRSTEASCVTVYNLSSKKIIQNLNFLENKEFKCEILNDGKLYMLFKAGYIGKYNFEKNEIERIDIGDFARHYEDIGRFVVSDDTICLLPATSAEKIYIFDMRNGSIHLYEDYPDDFKYDMADKLRSRYGEIKANGEYIYVAPRRASHLMEINKKTGEIIWHKIELDTDDNSIDYLRRGSIFNERTISLDFFMRSIARK